MRRALFVAPLCALLLGGPQPHPYRVKFMFAGPVGPDRERVRSAVTRGMFVDSLLVQADAPTPEPPDYADPKHSSTYIVRVALAPHDDSVAVKFDLLNILGWAAAHDSVHVVRASLDSVATEVGRRFAHTLARR
jgi:hypothetical protein